MGLFHYHRPSSPCPCCRGITDCRTNSSGGVHCRRTPPQMPPPGWKYATTDRQGFHVFYEEGSDLRQPAEWVQGRLNRQNAINEALKTQGKKKGPALGMLEWIKSHVRPLSKSESIWLSHLLRLPSNCFQLLDVGFLDNDRHNQSAFVFLEKDHLFNAIGWQLRYANGDKRNYGKRGLHIPDNFLKTDARSPVYVVEGASDTLAGSVLGMTTIGRPSATGGAEQLCKLLCDQCQGRPVVIVGENDEKADGSWPGRDGARQIAGKILKATGQAPRVALPPRGTKDIREWIIQNLSSLAQGTESLESLGFRLKNSFVFEDFFFVEDVLPKPKGGDGATESNLPYICPPGCQCPSCRLPAAKACADRCPNERAVPLWHKFRHLGRMIFDSCRRIGCAYCNKIRRRQYIETVKHHLENWGNDVFISRITGAKFPRIKKYLERKNGLWFCLRNGDGTSTMVSTIPLREDHVESSEQATWEQAAKNLEGKIQTLMDFGNNALTYCRAWKLLGDDERGAPAGWQHMGKYTGSERDMLDALERNDVEAKLNVVEGPYWKKRFWTWEASNDKLEAIFDELSSGTSWDGFWQKNPSPGGHGEGHGTEATQTERKQARFDFSVW